MPIYFSATYLRLMRAFSLKKNLQTLLNTEHVSNDVPCLHGIRALNAVALIVFHKSVALYFNPYVNRTYMAEVKQHINFAKCLFMD
jgi:predicted membrane protein